jgi:hypothetical protein
MKTISNPNGKFPKPFKFAMYLVLVSALSFLNYMTLSANDPGYSQMRSLEIRLAEALVPASDPETELEDWILTFSNRVLDEEKETKNNLESRLTEALVPVADPEPEIENWMLYSSDDLMGESGE